MTKTSHRIRIKAQPDHVYAAIATTDGLKAWFTPDIEGDVAAGKTAWFRHDGRDSFRWKFVDLKPDTLAQWECVEGPGAATGTHVVFRLHGDGQTTIVECDHDAWPDGHGAFDTCNTLWGILMGRLKAYSETGTSQPALS